MGATFRSVVLAQPEIAAAVLSYQFGIYEDVRLAFAACRELVEFSNLRMYECDSSFPTTFAPDAAWACDPFSQLCPCKYCLDGYQRDARFPLHVAIVGGFVQLTKRIVLCRPDLVSEDTILLAFSEDRIEIVELLLDLRETMPELRHFYISDDFVEHVALHQGNAVETMLARDDSKGVALLQRFGLRHEAFADDDMRCALAEATLENAALALNAFLWLQYPELFHDVAYWGFLSSVQTLHERGAACTTAAMDDAATEGHLDVVQFLHDNRTEGCTDDALRVTVKSGHLDVVRFLIEHRAEAVPLATFNWAVQGDASLEVVEYLHSLGTLGWTIDAVKAAAANGKPPVIEFLLANGYDGGTRDGDVQAALEKGNLRTAEYLLSLGNPFPPPSTVVRFACCVVRFLHERTSTCGHCSLLEHALKRCAWDVVDYLVANCTADLTNKELKVALQAGDHDVAAHILQRKPELRLDDTQLQWAVSIGCTESTRYLLEEGIGEPRECLNEVAGRRPFVSVSKILLPYCMDAANHLDNIVFLLQLAALPDRRRSTMLQLISADLTYQGEKASPIFAIVEDPPNDI